jgi:fucose permease
MDICINFFKILRKKIPNTFGLIFISFIAFISLGLPDGLLGVAWPGIRRHFFLPVDALGLVLVFGTGGYMFSSFFSGVLVRRFGVGGLLSMSCAATACTLLVYAVTPFWWLFVIFAAVGGLGAGAIDAGINTFVAKHHSTRMMQWLHASFGVGITSGPIIMTLGISITLKWQVGYIIVFIAQGVLAIIFFVTKDMWEGITINNEEKHHAKYEATLIETMRLFPALLSMLMFFIYTGVELGLGLWMYSLLTESRGVSPEVAGIMTGSYWAMFTFGRILAGWFTSKINSGKLIYVCIFLAILGVCLLCTNTGQLTAILGILLAGFAIAPIFPGLVSDTINRVGHRHHGNTIGMQIAAAGLGAAVVPSIAGILAEIYGFEAIPYYLLSALILLFLSFVFSHVHSVKYK